MSHDHDRRRFFAYLNLFIAAMLLLVLGDSYLNLYVGWEGVNYVLGAGLHSYGFGAGGVEYVSAFIFIHLVYVAVTSIIRKGRQKVIS